MNIAIIPARIGSIRIKKKNIKKFNNFPIIHYSIKAALNSNLFDDVIISTDSAIISKMGKKMGANVPFLRPKYLSGNKTGIVEVISHVIKKYKLIYKKNISFVCCILPTAPFIQIKDIKAGFKKIIIGKYPYVISVSNYEFPIDRAFILDKNNHIKNYSPTFYKKRSQDLNDVFFDAGLFYWGSANSWINKKPIFSKTTSTIMIPRWRVQDIDTIDDWKRSEIMYKIINN